MTSYPRIHAFDCLTYALLFSQKFDFMGGHDVPDWLLAEIPTLSRVVRGNSLLGLLGPMPTPMTPAPAPPLLTVLRTNEASV